MDHGVDDATGGESDECSGVGRGNADSSDVADIDGTADSSGAVDVTDVSDGCEIVVEFVSTLLDSLDIVE